MDLGGWFAGFVFWLPWLDMFQDLCVLGVLSLELAVLVLGSFGGFVLLAWELNMFAMLGRVNVARH